MAKTIDQILGFENLTGLIRNPAGGVPDDLLPPAFMTMTEPVVGKTATWTETRAARTTLRQTGYGQPSTRREQQQEAVRSSILMHFFEHELHDAVLLQAVRNFDNPQAQRMGQQRIDNQVVEFRRMLNNTRLAAIYSMLATGQIFYDGAGNQLPTSSGAVLTVDMQPGANNRDQLNGIIDIVWSNAAAKIITDVKQIKEQARKTSGLRLRHAFYGLNIPDYLLTNNQTKEIINRSPELRLQLASGEIPDGFMGFQWWSVNEAFFEDNDGTNQDFFDDDLLVFTPEVTRDWYTLFEGSYVIPSNIGGISADANAALADLALVQGMFSYAKIIDDPAGIKHYVGDTFLNVLKNPDAIFQATVAGF